MEGDLQRAGQFDQFAGAFRVDCAVGVEHTDHDAVDAHLLESDDVVFHHGKLVVGVEKVAAAWPDDHVDLDPDLLQGVVDRAHAGGGAAFEKVLAQFDAGRAALFRCDG